MITDLMIHYTSPLWLLSTALELGLLMLFLRPPRAASRRPCEIARAAGGPGSAVARQPPAALRFRLRLPRQHRACYRVHRTGRAHSPRSGPLPCLRVSPLHGNREDHRRRRAAYGEAPPMPGRGHTPDILRGRESTGLHQRFRFVHTHRQRRRQRHRGHLPAAAGRGTRVIMVPVPSSP